MTEQKAHPLEGHDSEREYFRNLSKNGRAAYRRAVMVLTEGLPTWAVGPRSKQPNVTYSEAINKHLERPEIKALLDKMLG
jgi:hypothetical protein